MPAAILFLFAGASAHAETIRVDGDLNDAAWQKARAIEAFKTFDGKTPQTSTTGLLLTDAENLYLAFRCQEPQMDKLEATPLPRDGSLWTNDCIEIYAAPFQKPEEYFQIIVDTSGQVFDAFKRNGSLDPRYDLSVTAKVQKQNDGWTLEASIPLAELGVSSARAPLMNFGRERKPVTENTSWHGVFGKPETWQPLPLTLDSRYSPDARDWNFGAAQYGDNDSGLEFTPGQAAPLEVLVQAQEGGQWKTKGRKAAQSTPGQATRVALPYSLVPLDKPQAVRLELVNGGQPVFRSTYRLNLPPDALVETLSVPYYYADEKWGFVQLESQLSDAGLKASSIRLTVKNPAGKTVSTQEIRSPQKSMRAGFDISSWREGSGSVVAELITNGKVLSSRRTMVRKRPGPFSPGT